VIDNPEFEKEAYDNYLVLKELGVRVVGNLEETKYFYGLSNTNKYELLDKNKKLKVRLIPHYHSKRAVNSYGSLATPLVEQYSLNKLLTTTANDLLATNFNANIELILKDSRSFIELYREPVDCDFYDVFVSLAHSWNRFKLVVKEGKEIHLIPKYIASKKITLERYLTQSPNLTEQEKDAMRRDIQITKILK
jgi:hypothetical protein